MSFCIRCGRQSTDKESNTNYIGWTFIHVIGGSSRGELTSSWVAGMQVSVDDHVLRWNTVGLCPECHITDEQRENILNTE
jgi:hypothetical protein